MTATQQLGNYSFVVLPAIKEQYISGGGQWVETYYEGKYEVIPVTVVLTEQSVYDPKPARGGTGLSASVTFNTYSAPGAAALAAEDPVALAPPPERRFSRGPKTSTITLQANGSVAKATAATAGVVFGLYGYSPSTACSVYWEYVCNATAATLGGFGVGGSLTEITSAPGKSTNPGCMLYYESSVYTVWVNGLNTVLTGPASPTRFGVSVTAVAEDEVAVRFFVDGTEITTTPIQWVFSGPMWVPTLCTLANGLIVTMEFQP